MLAGPAAALSGILTFVSADRWLMRGCTKLFLQRVGAPEPFISPSQYPEFIGPVGNEATKDALIKACKTFIMKVDGVTEIIWTIDCKPWQKAVEMALEELAPTPPDTAFDQNMLIINPIGTNDIQLTLTEAQERGVWCYVHEQPLEGWGSEHAVCSQCMQMLYAALTASQWERMISSWLDGIDADDRIFFLEMMEEMADPESGRRELARRICAVALIHGVTLRIAAEGQLLGYI